jgi:phage terminase Nu1 subunit (DNA packaging protein)
MAKKEAEKLVDVGLVAQEFGCSVRQVQLYVQAGMPKAGHGKYDLLPCFRWYTQRLKQDLSEAGETGNLEFEQTRVQRATADIKEMEGAKMRGELIPLEIYKQHVAAHFTVVRQNILALAAQIAPQLEGLDRLEIKNRLHQKNRDILTALATGQELNHAINNNNNAADADHGRATIRRDSKKPDIVPDDPGARDGTAPGRPRTGRNTCAASRSKPKRVVRKKPGVAKRHK